MRSDLLRQLGENSFDLFDLLALELANSVAGFDCRWRLDEESSSGLRSVVNDSADCALRFAPNGDDETTIADGDGHVSHALMLLELGHRALEQLDQLTLRALELATNATEIRRRVVANLTVVVDRVGDRVLERFVRSERLYLFRQNRHHDRAGALSAKRFTRHPRAPQKRTEYEQIRRSE